MKKYSAIAIGCLSTLSACATSPLPTSDRTTAAACETSAHWGDHGELWKGEDRLPDYSYAGYHAGEAPIPTERARWDLKKDFGAKGDGATDDTAALKQAIEKIKSGVLYIPEGTYIIQQEINISKNHFVLRGAGTGKTILTFPKSLSDIHGYSVDEEGSSNFSFSPGFINIDGKIKINANTRLAQVTSPAKRGTDTLELSDTRQIRTGQWIRLVESDPKPGTAHSGTLIAHLYGDLMPSEKKMDEVNMIGADKIVRFLSRVQAVTPNHITLERPLPYDVRPEWQPEIHRIERTVEEVGIEELSIHFPWSEYPGHFKERGFNGVFFHETANCWMKNVEIQNSDFAVSFKKTEFCTMDHITLNTSKDRSGSSDNPKNLSGHHGLDVLYGSENLVTNFNINTTFYHDLSVEWFALHTVYLNGRGVDLNFDHHREANYSSLFSNIDCGKGTRPFYSGGSGNRGPHSGAYSTYWNVHAAAPMHLPPPDFGPRLNFMGFQTEDATDSDALKQMDWMIESPQSALCPFDLHQAMLEKRLEQ